MKWKVFAMDSPMHILRPKFQYPLLKGCDFLSKMLNYVPAENVISFFLDSESELRCLPGLKVLASGHNASSNWAPQSKGITLVPVKIHLLIYRYIYKVARMFYYLFSSGLHLIQYHRKHIDLGPLAKEHHISEFPKVLLQCMAAASCTWSLSVLFLLFQKRQLSTQHRLSLAPKEILEHYWLI